MYRVKLTALVLAVLLILTSCSFGAGEAGSDSMYYKLNAEGDIANALFEKVLEAVENKDSAKLKSMFSQKALNEAEKLDEGIEYLFNLTQGDVVSWDREKWSSDDSIRNGKTSRMIRSWFVLTTTEDTYLFFLLDYDKDELDSENKGLYALRAIKAENRETQFTYWQDMEIPGIYIPE